MIIQIKLGPMDNFSYIISDDKTKEAAVIDPGWEADKILKKIMQHNLKLKYILITHAHFDHSQEVEKIKEKTNAEIVCNQNENFKSDMNIKEKDIIKLGDKTIKVIETPGHTLGSVGYLFDSNHLFTGDTLFAEGMTGRTDLEGGNPKKLQKSVEKLLAMDEKIIVYPGHDYSFKKISTISEERWFHNYR